MKRWPPQAFARRAAPRLALALRQQPVEPRADEHDDIGFRQHVRACRRCRLLVRVGQQALGHRHRQVRDAGLLDQRADVGIGLRVGRALAEDDQGLAGALEQIERALHGIGRGNLLRRGVDDLDQRRLAGRGVDRLREQLRGKVEVHAAGAPGHRRADRARDADADVLGVQHAERRLAQRLGDRELVHLLVVALRQVDDLALGRAADQDHREAVGRRVRERRQAVEETRRGDGEADPRLLRQESGDRCRVAGVLLVAERDDAQAFLLHPPGEIGDRNAGQAEDRVDAVELEGVDDELEAVGLLRRRARRAAGDLGRTARGARSRRGGYMFHEFLRTTHPAGEARTRACQRFD